MLVSLSRPSDSPKAGTSMPKARIAVRPVTTEKVRSRKRGLASTLNTNTNNHKYSIRYEWMKRGRNMGWSRPSNKRHQWKERRKEETQKKG